MSNIHPASLECECIINKLETKELIDIQNIFCYQIEYKKIKKEFNRYFYIEYNYNKKYNIFITNPFNIKINKVYHLIKYISIYNNDDGGHMLFTINFMDLWLYNKLNYDSNTKIYLPNINLATGNYHLKIMFNEDKIDGLFNTTKNDVKMTTKKILNHTKLPNDIINIISGYIFPTLKLDLYCGYYSIPSHIFLPQHINRIYSIDKYHNFNYVIDKHTMEYNAALYNYTNTRIKSIIFMFYDMNFMTYDILQNVEIINICGSKKIYTNNYLKVVKDYLNYKDTNNIYTIYYGNLSNTSYFITNNDNFYGSMKFNFKYPRLKDLNLYIQIKFTE